MFPEIVQSAVAQVMEWLKTQDMSSVVITKDGFSLMGGDALAQLNELEKLHEEVTFFRDRFGDIWREQ